MVKASFENVEKVVKPPQSPTVRNNPHEVLSEAFLLKNPQSKPIVRQPNRLTKSVAQGKSLLIPFMARETRYLAIPPIKLPAPTVQLDCRGSSLIVANSRELELLPR